MAKKEDTRPTSCVQGSYQFIQVNEIRSATDADFDYFIHLANDNGEGTDWVEKLDKNDVKIWLKEAGSSSVKMALVVRQFQGVSAGTAFDTIMDGEYRKTWDDNVIEDYELCRLDNWNDIGYYSMKCPTPLKNRDFVNQRSWRAYEDQFVTFNHSVSVKDIPLSRKFIRAVSYITGFLIRSSKNGCTLNYVTHSDVKGNIPSWIINLAIHKIAPAIFKKLYSASCQYEEWKSKHRPEFKPWRYPEQNELKIMDPKSITSSETSSEDVEQVNEALEEEEAIPEQETEEFFDGFCETIDEEVQFELTNGH